MKTNAHALVVPANPAAETNDIRAIKPPIEIPAAWAWLWWIVLALALAAAGALLWRHFRRRPDRPAGPPPVPPHFRAKERLCRALLLFHDPRLFCITVSDAIRLYLEERYQFHAPDRTTEEFLAELQKTDLLTPDQKQSLGEFLQLCDLAKFARHEPTEAELRQLLESATRLVDETQFEKIEAPAPALKP